MNDHLDDQRLRQLIRQAYQDEHLSIDSQGVIMVRRHVPSRRTAIAMAGVVVVAVLVGSWTILGGRGGSAPPGGSATSSPPAASGSPAPGQSHAPGGKVFPSSTATTAIGRCTDYSLQEMARTPGLSTSERRQLPPLRFERVVVAGELDLLMFASDTVQVACWVFGEDAVVSINSSMMDIGNAKHPTGSLSYASDSWGREPIAGFAFGRVPDGVTDVRIFYPDGSFTKAALANGWYVVTVSGNPALGRLAEVTKVVAYASGKVYTTPVLHG